MVVSFSFLMDGGGLEMLSFASSAIVGVVADIRQTDGEN